MALEVENESRAYAGGDPADQRHIAPADRHHPSERQAVIRLLAFVAKWQGRRITAPGGIGGQCVDLANVYLIDCFGAAPVRADAAAWARIDVPGFRWIANGPSNFPAPGDIVVWGPSVGVSVGVAGHIATSILADGFVLLSFDQNWPAGSGCALTLHDYRGVLGWHTPLAG